MTLPVTQPSPPFPPQGPLVTLLAVVLVTAGAITLADESPATEHEERGCLDIGEFRGPEYCGSCHPQHYQEWRGSAHAYASIDPIFQACNRRAQADTDGKIGQFCIGCHLPVGARTGVLQNDLKLQHLDTLPAVVSRGVSCEVCHRMQPPKEGAAIGNASFE